MRSFHAYRFEDGKKVEVEGEFLFLEEELVEMAASPFLILLKLCILEVFVGCVMASCFCFFAFVV